MLFSTRTHPNFSETDTSPLRSPFIDIERLPENLDRLPNKLWPFCWFFFRQVKWSFLLFFIPYVIAGSITAAIPYFVGQIIQVFETSDPKHLWDNLRQPLLIFFICYGVVDTATYHSARFVWGHLAWPFRAMVSRQLQLYIRNHSISYFQNDFAGRLANKMNDVAENLRGMLREISTPLTFGVIQFITAIVLSLQVHWHFTAVFGVYIAGYLLVLAYFLPRLMRRSVLTQDSKTAITGQIVDVMSNIYSVKIFARDRFEDSRTLGFINDMARKGRRLGFGFNKLYMWFDVLVKPLWVVIIGMLVHGIAEGTVSFAQAAMILPIAISMTNIMWWFTEILIVVMEQAGTVQDGINTIVKPFTLRDKENAPALAAPRGDITITNVTFGYPSRDVFENLNLTIPAGQKVGLVGPSGAGKSTLMQLLLRLHDIQGGAIEIDDQNIADVTQESLRSKIAVIPQSSDLLHRSIRENIAYGRLDATEDDIIAAAKKAHAHEFILSLSDHQGGTGYDAMVGERGVKLSGGQRQRIAIARAVLKDAPILLLDEATSALDSQSERAIQESLTDIMAGRTVIAIAHRLSTIARLDRLIVMDNGRIIEDGTHQQLLDKNGLYARLWALQSGGFLPEEM